MLPRPAARRRSGQIQNRSRDHLSPFKSALDNVEVTESLLEMASKTNRIEMTGPAFAHVQVKAFEYSQALLRLPIDFGTSCRSRQALRLMGKNAADGSGDMMSHAHTHSAARRRSRPTARPRP